MEKIKALFLAANPEGTNHLKLDEEIRAITEKIRAAEYRDSIDLVSTWAVRSDDLLQALNTHKPHIVHFSGHGSSAGEILVVDSHGQAKPVSANALKALFTTLKDNVRIVILNACYTRIQAEAITEIIDFGIGMDAAIGDRAAILFAASFYRAIGFGRSVQEAFDQGKVALLLEGIPEDHIPELLVRMCADPNDVLCKPNLTDIPQSQFVASMRALSGEISLNLNRLGEFIDKKYHVVNNRICSVDGEDVLLDYFSCMISVFESSETLKALAFLEEHMRGNVYKVYEGFRKINDKSDALKHAFRPWRASLYIEAVVNFKTELYLTAEKLSGELVSKRTIEK